MFICVAMGNSSLKRIVAAKWNTTDTLAFSICKSSSHIPKPGSEISPATAISLSKDCWGSFLSTSNNCNEICNEYLVHSQNINEISDLCVGEVLETSLNSDTSLRSHQQVEAFYIRAASQQFFNQDFSHESRRSRDEHTTVAVELAYFRLHFCFTLEWTLPTSRESLYRVFLAFCFILLLTTSWIKPVWELSMLLFFYSNIAKFMRNDV